MNDDSPNTSADNAPTDPEPNCSPVDNLPPGQRLGTGVSVHLYAGAILPAPPGPPRMTAGQRRGALRAAQRAAKRELSRRRETRLLAKPKLTLIRADGTGLDLELELVEDRVAGKLRGVVAKCDSLSPQLWGRGADRKQALASLERKVSAWVKQAAALVAQEQADREREAQAVAMAQEVLAAAEASAHTHTEAPALPPGPDQPVQVPSFRVAGPVGCDSDVEPGDLARATSEFLADWQADASNGEGLHDGNATRIGTMAEVPAVEAARAALAGNWKGRGKVPWQALADGLMEALGYNGRSVGVTGGRAWYELLPSTQPANAHLPGYVPALPDDALPAPLAKVNSWQKFCAALLRHHNEHKAGA